MLFYTEQQREKTTEEKRKEQKLRTLRDHNKRIQHSFIVLPEGEEKENESEKVLKEIMDENFMNLAKDIIHTKAHHCQTEN